MPGYQQQPANRSPVEQGQLQFQNTSYSMNPSQSAPLQMGPSQLTPQQYQVSPAQGNQMTPEMLQQMYAQAAGGVPKQPSVGISPGRILEALHSNESNREIKEKFRVTNIALKALRGLKKRYGKHYKTHMDDVKAKVKYFSGYVMEGDPIQKLTILKNKLKNAQSMIQRKRRLKKREKRRSEKQKKKSRKLTKMQKIKKQLESLMGKKKGKKGKRKLLLGEIMGDGLKAVGGEAMKALRKIRFEAYLKTTKKPTFASVLRKTRLGSPGKFIEKNIGPKKKVNKDVLANGTGPLIKEIKQKLKKKGLKFPMRFKFEPMLGIKPAFEKNLRKLDKQRKKVKKELQKQEKKLKKIENKLKAQISSNNVAFQKYKATATTPKMGQKRAPNKKISNLKFDPNMNMVSFKGIDSIDCGQQRRTFLYQSVNQSDLKKKYCQYVYSHFKKVRIAEIAEYIRLSRQELMSILSMKRSLYCGVCDATLQNNFDEKQKLVLYSQRFCHDLVSQYKDYLKFRHIILVELFDQFFQMMHCFEFRNELGIDYPYRTMLEAKKRRITSIRRCFENLNTPHFYRFCYFVCSQFNIIKFSPFFDGDLDMMKTIFAKFTTFYRRYKQYKKNMRKAKKKKSKKKRGKKRIRKLRIKHQNNFTQALIKPSVETQTGLAEVPQTQDVETTTHDLSQKIKKKRRKRKRKMNRQDRQKLKSLKRHVDQVHNSLTDEISMLVMNHKKIAKAKAEQKADREKYLKDYQDGIKGKKILSKKHKKSRKLKKKSKKKEDSIFLDAKPKIDFPENMNDSDFFIDDLPPSNSQNTKNVSSKAQNAEDLQKAEASQTNKKKTMSAQEHASLWGGRRLSSIQETFSNELQNSLFMERLAKESQREAELTQKVQITSDDQPNDRDLRVKMTVKQDKDAANVAPPKKIKLPKPKPGFSYGAKKKKTIRAKVRKKLSFLRFHTESNRLPVYFNYQINPRLKTSFSETAYQKSIYLKTELPFAVKTFRPFFLKSAHGFNPLRTTEMMRLDFDPRQIINLTRKKNYKPELLSRKVVTSYMAFDREYMAGFKHDIDLDFDGYGHTHDKNYTSRSIHPKFQMIPRGKRKKPFRRDDSKPFKPQSEWEFHNPDNQDLHGHYRKNVSNDPHGYLWHKLFGR